MSQLYSKSTVLNISPAWLANKSMITNEYDYLFYTEDAKKYFTWFVRVKNSILIHKTLHHSHGSLDEGSQLKT